MTPFNLTSRPVHLRDRTIPPSGMVARATISLAGELSIVGLPDPQPDVVFIVTPAAASAAADLGREDVVTVRDGELVLEPLPEYVLDPAAAESEAARA